MNLSQAESKQLAAALLAGVPAGLSVEVAVCPPFVYIDTVRGVLQGSPIGWGAQNVYHEGSGAFTGEVSPGMLRDLGCTYVILGHSERRHVLHETDEDVNRKVHASLAAGLMPIVCVGELLEERKDGRTLEVISDQFEGSLAGLTAEAMAKCVIAYEPVWAIGTGQVATPAQAEEVHAAVRGMLHSHFNAEVAAQVRIQYGGSVKPDNAAELMSQPNIDGALVGGASLKADSFWGIVQGAADSVRPA
jgi:triosephosphate isomerase